MAQESQSLSGPDETAMTTLLDLIAERRKQEKEEKRQKPPAELQLPETTATMITAQNMLPLLQEVLQQSSLFMNGCVPAPHLYPASLPSRGRRGGNVNQAPHASQHVMMAAQQPIVSPAHSSAPLGTVGQPGGQTVAHPKPSPPSMTALTPIGAVAPPVEQADMWDTFGYATTFMIAQFEYVMSDGPLPYEVHPAQPETSLESDIDHKVAVLDSIRNTDEVITRHAGFIEKNSLKYRGLFKWHEWTNPEHSTSDITDSLAPNPLEWWVALPRLCHCRLRASQHAPCACHNHGAAKYSIHSEVFLNKLHTQSALKAICEEPEDGFNMSCDKQCFSEENLAKAERELKRKTQRAGRAPPSHEEILDVAACTCARCHRFIDAERSESLVPVLHAILEGREAHKANGHPLGDRDRTQLLAMVFAQQLRKHFRMNARKALDAGSPVVAVIQDHIEDIGDPRVKRKVTEHFAEFMPEIGQSYKPPVPEEQLERLFMADPGNRRDVFESINVCLELVLNHDDSYDA